MAYMGSKVRSKPRPKPVLSEEFRDVCPGSRFCCPRHLNKASVVLLETLTREAFPILGHVEFSALIWRPSAELLQDIDSLSLPPSSRRGRTEVRICVIATDGTSNGNRTGAAACKPTQFVHTTKTYTRQGGTLMGHLKFTMRVHYETWSICTHTHSVNQN